MTFLWYLTHNEENQAKIAQMATKNLYSKPFAQTQKDIHALSQQVHALSILPAAQINFLLFLGMAFCLKVRHYRNLI